MTEVSDSSVGSHIRTPLYVLFRSLSSAASFLNVRTKSFRLIFVILLSIVSAVPVAHFSDAESHGPKGTISVLDDWHRFMGTAMHVMLLSGPARKNAVLHSALSPAFRDALRTVRKPCQITDDSQCEVAVNGFGTIGEVQYEFMDGIRNFVGRATQVMVACRCVDEHCGRAVLIRPINVFEELSPDSSKEPVQKTCLYEAVGNEFSDCYTEVLRSVRRKIHHEVEYTRGNNNFSYNVDRPALQANWTARGQRGWTRDCSVSEIDSLETVTTESLRTSHIRQQDHSTPADNGCKPPAGVKYFREEDPEAGEACYETYEYAAVFASNLASRQDDFAFGQFEEGYAKPKPPLVSDTELGLSCSAAGLGVLLAWDLFRNQLSNTNNTGIYVVVIVVFQILGFTLDSLPLHMALRQEINARAWRSEFAFLDGSIAVASDALRAQRSAEGSVFVLTALLGTAQYPSTRVGVLAGLVALFDIIAFGLVIATIVTMKQGMEQATTTGEVDEEKGGYMSGIFGWYSREIKKQEFLRLESRLGELESQVGALHARKLTRLQNNGIESDHWLGKKSSSTGRLSVDVTSASASTDNPEDMFDVQGSGDSLDEDGGFPAGMRRRGFS